jgi:hypothetical protein
VTPPGTRHMIATACRPRRGIFMADVMTAMAIVAALAVSMFVLLARANQVARKMAGSRAATRAAESQLAGLQSAQPLVPEPGQEIAVHPEPGGAAVPGCDWVRVTATVAGQSADVIGLVPDAPGLHQAQAANPTTRPSPSGPTPPAVSRANPAATREAP